MDPFEECFACHGDSGMTNISRRYEQRDQIFLCPDCGTIEIIRNADKLLARAKVSIKRMKEGTQP